MQNNTKVKKSAKDNKKDYSSQGGGSRGTYKTKRMKNKGIKNINKTTGIYIAFKILQEYCTWYV